MKIKNWDKYIIETDAADAAKKLGLTSIGFGRWADKSGKVVANTVKGKLVPKKQQSDAPSKGKPSLPIHRDFQPAKSAPAGVPTNRPKPPVHPDFDPIQTAQPTANQPKRSEPTTDADQIPDANRGIDADDLAHLSSKERKERRDVIKRIKQGKTPSHDEYNRLLADPEDPQHPSKISKKVDPSVGPKLDKWGNPSKPQSDAQKKFKPLVKGADGKWGSGEPSREKISSADRAAAGDYNADDDKSLDRNKPAPGQSQAQADFKPLKRGTDFDDDPIRQKYQKQADDEFAKYYGPDNKYDQSKPKKKSGGMKLGNIMKSIKDKFR